MTREIPESHPLHRLFRGLTEHTFQVQLGIGDPRLVGYVADILVRFVHRDGSHEVRDVQGRLVTELVGLLEEASQAGDCERRRECFRTAGDLALFWTGVFPEALQKRPSDVAALRLSDYQREGKRSYYLASTCGEDDQTPVLRRLSAEFELCAFGLARVRQEWEALPVALEQDGKGWGLVA